MQEAIRWIDRYVEQRRCEANNPALTVAITDPERTVHLGLYGVADLE